PSPSGFLSNCQITATITTNNSNGYTVYLSSNDENTCPSFTDACLTGIGTAAGSFITPTTGDFSHPQTLTSNTWGFAIPEPEVTRDEMNDDPLTDYTFDDTYTINALDAGKPDQTIEEQNFINAKYAKLPLKTNPIKVKETTSQVPDGEDLDIFLATKSSFNLPSGSYTGSLLIAVSAKDPNFPEPTVQSVSPSVQGGLTGGTEITITGTNFKYDYNGNILDIVTNVTIGGEYCTNINVIDANTLKCNTPDQATYGQRAVVVVTRGGQSNIDIMYEYVVTAQTGDPIQNITTISCPSTPTAVIDTRDNHYYAIAKMPDNKCWMLTNLAYGGTEAGTQFTSGAGQNTTTNVAASDTNWNRTNPPYNNQKQWVDPTVSAVTQGSGTRCAVAYRTTSSSISYTECGYLYNWCAALGAASADCNTSTNGAVNPNAGVGICPAGWRLPTGGDDGEFQALYTALDSTYSNAVGTGSLWRGVIQSGYFNGGVGLSSQGTNGSYWSATNSSSTFAHYLYITSSGLSPKMNNGQKYLGISVRCVAAN
ncbi:MAG: IPT/TIG domain-containing protein, partial [Candidatus Nomurabacteria bacterium]|nr:IPT/TIG domain-containing protein [Candidatus Nomurabacteria bacterium]